MTKFSYDEVEAALCVWECINEWTLYDTGQEDWIKLRDGIGASELRCQSVELGQWCLAIYNHITAGEPLFFDHYAYDWEVIPMILDFARDADGCPVIYKEGLPYVKATATLVIERFRRAA